VYYSDFILFLFRGGLKLFYNNMNFSFDVIFS